MSAERRKVAWTEDTRLGLVGRGLVTHRVAAARDAVAVPMNARFFESSPELLEAAGR